MDTTPVALAHQLPHWDRPIRYIDRTHAWYGALGYANPYQYAHFQDVPFQPLRKPLSVSTVALLTTAAPFQQDLGAQGADAPYNASAKFYQVYSGDTSQEHDLRVSHVEIDRNQITDDSATWFPLSALRRAAAARRVGRIAPRFHGVPTNRSQRHTLQVDCPEVLARCLADKVDVAIAVANCPVCHQSISLAARHLEANGIATIVMGAAKDIVECCGVARFLFSDFPLGNAAGLPHDLPSQDATLELALRVLESAPVARTTVQNPLRWSGAADWRLKYMNLADLGADEIARQRTEHDRAKRVAQAVRDAALRRT